MDATWVAKVGGSLLEPPDFPELPDRLRAVLAARGGCRPILVVGGGPTVDVIRRWDRVYALGESFSHWLCVRMLSINARMAERLLPDSVLVDTDVACQEAWKRGLLPIVDCFRFLVDRDEVRPDPLPRGWAVTSDSIAARVAEHYGAPELALLKSTGVPDGLTRSEAAALGHVDSHFCVAAARLPICVSINLRASPPTSSRLR